jgi:hypothetical protein
VDVVIGDVAPVAKRRGRLAHGIDLGLDRLEARLGGLQLIADGRDRRLQRFNLRIVELSKNKHLRPGKKLPITLAIKAAKYEHQNEYLLGCLD